MKPEKALTMADYKIGDKIRANPDTLAHFNADYTGAVEAFEGKNIIMVRMDRTRKLVPFRAEQMTKIEVNHDNNANT